MKQLNYFQEPEDHGYIFDPTVYDQEEIIPIWDEHSYECIVSNLLSQMDLDSLARNIIVPEHYDDKLDECYNEIFEQIETALNMLWEIIRDNNKQCVFVHHENAFVMFDGTFQKEINEFAIVYTDDMSFYGTSVTFFWREGLSVVQ